MQRFVSFDPASKTLAFIIATIDMKLFSKDIVDKHILARRLIDGSRMLINNPTLDKLETIKTFDRKLRAIYDEVRPMIHIEYGHTVDLVPGVADDDIDPIQRTKALCMYIESYVRPLLNGSEIVMIEFQMGPNNKSGIIAYSLMTLFYQHQIITVQPSLKNKIAVGGNYYYIFSAKYDKSYTANKKHALANFKAIESRYRSDIPESSDSLRGHIADAFMQILGYYLIQASQGEQ